MSIPAGNDATGASGTDSVLGYILNLFWFKTLFMFISENNMNTNTYFVHTLSLIYAKKLLVIFKIKIYRKLLSYLTQPPLPARADRQVEAVAGRRVGATSTGGADATSHPATTHRAAMDPPRSHL